MKRANNATRLLAFGVSLFVSVTLSVAMAQPSPPSPDDRHQAALIQEMRAYKDRCSTIAERDAAKFARCVNQKKSLEERAIELGMPETQEIRHWKFHGGDVLSFHWICHGTHCQRP